MTNAQRVEAHLERFLGPVMRYTTGRTESLEAPFRVAAFVDRPADEALTLVTIGLSDRPLGQPPVRQELLLCAWKSEYTDSLYDALLGLGDEMRRQDAEVPHGSVIQMPAPLFAGGPEQLLVYTPTYFDDAFAVVPGDPPVELIWLIPLTRQESDFIVTGAGLPAFEDILLTEDPDLLDLHRPPVV